MSRWGALQQSGYSCLQTKFCMHALLQISISNWWCDDVQLTPIVIYLSLSLKSIQTLFSTDTQDTCIQKLWLTEMRQQSLYITHVYHCVCVCVCPSLLTYRCGSWICRVKLHSEWKQWISVCVHWHFWSHRKKHHCLTINNGRWG